MAEQASSQKIVVPYQDVMEAGVKVLKVLRHIHHYSAHVWLQRFEPFEYQTNQDGYETTEKGQRIIQAILGPHGHTVIKAMEAQRKW